METAHDPDMPIDRLLPLRALVVTLECLAPGNPRFFHQAALTAFLRFLLGESAPYDTHLRIDCPESGRVAYAPGDLYRFSVFCLRGGEGLLASLMDRLAHLPGSARKSVPTMPFRDNWRLRSLQDAFTGQAVTAVEALAAYDLDTLGQEARLWTEYPRLRWRWLTPARLLKEKERRLGLKGEAQFCRDAADLPPALLLNRLHDSLADLLERHGAPRPQRRAPPPLTLQGAHLFWVDSEYTTPDGEDIVMGGICGRLDIAGQLSPAWLRLLILGQYTGIGQRVAFGFGRYQLCTPEGGVSYRRPLAAASVLALAATPDNLASAWHHVLSNSDILPAQFGEEAAWSVGPATIDDEADEPPLPDAPVAALQKDMERLQAGVYQVPELRGYLLRKQDGGLRPLAVPPYRDRVLQRAVHQRLAAAIENLLARGAHGFRPGRSRITASDAIRAAWRAGYRWVYESDVRDFFDSVDLERLRERLQALYDQDPVVAAAIAWMRAPVRFEGELIERANGLPQGSPLSPLLANLMLDDFDSDMQTAGFHLIRFADDFVVLCKDPDEARRAGEAAQASLAEHGLALHPDKTRIAAMDEGFRYLGYLFVNDMVLDVSGNRGAGTANDKIPPASWLARLAEREPAAVKEADSLDDLLARIARREPLKLGEREQEGNLLCFTGEPCLIATRDKHLQVVREEQVVHHVPWQGLQAVILFGRHQITTPAMHAALEYGVPLHLASAMGTYRGVLWDANPGPPGVDLWLRQAALFTDPAAALPAARELVGARLRHMKETLRLRQKGWDTAVLDQAIRTLHQADSYEELLGYEGRGTREYYLRLGELLPAEFGFAGRNRRPPRDPFNVLLSLGYTLLFGYTESIVRAAGLLPWQGFYHQGRGRHAALASDLMEPFRHVVERAALTLVLRSEVRIDNFSYTPAGACLLDSASCRKYLALLAERFETQVTALGEETPAKLFAHIHRQALSVRDWIAKGTAFKAWRIR